MSKYITVVYNNTTIIDNQGVPNSNITYNNATIQDDFLGIKTLQCKDKVAVTNIAIGGTKTLICKDKIFASNIIVTSIAPVGPKPTNLTPSSTYNGTEITNGYNVSRRYYYDW